MLADEFWEGFGWREERKIVEKIAKTVIPFEKYTGQQAFGFVKEVKTWTGLCRGIAWLEEKKREKLLLGRWSNMDLRRKIP